MLPSAQIADISGVLQDLNVEEGVIADVVKFLEQSAGDLEINLPGVTQTSFGGSWRGGSLGHHTALAHEKLASSLVNMVSNLRGVGANVQQFAQDVVDTDDLNGQRFKALVTGLDCVNASGFAAPDVCGPSGSGA